MRSTISQYPSCSTKPTRRSSLQRAVHSSPMRDVWRGYLQGHILFGSFRHANRLSAVFVCLHEVGILPGVVLDGFPREEFVISGASRTRTFGAGCWLSSTTEPLNDPAFMPTTMSSDSADCRVRCKPPFKT